MSIEIKTLGDIAARFDISTEEAERIAETVNTEQEFVSVWQSKDWWTDEKNTGVETAKYRFDSGLGQIHEYDKAQRAYIFLGTYTQYGISARMSDKKKIEKIEKQKDHDWLVENR